MFGEILGRLGKKKAETQRMEEELRDMRRRRAKIRDMAVRAAAGAAIPGGTAGSTEELLDLLGKETVRKEHNALRARIAQMNAEMRGELARLQEENAVAEIEINEPLSLLLTAPEDGEVIGRGQTLEVSWISSGPVADKLRVALLRNGSLLKMLSLTDTPRREGSFKWLIPANFPTGEFQVVVQDPVSGLSSQSNINIK